MNSWFNPTVIFKYTPTSKTAVAIRAEYYDDKNGVIIAKNLFGKKLTDKLAEIMN